MKVRVSRPLLAVCANLCLLNVSIGDDINAALDSYRGAAIRIKSFDVVYKVEALAFPNAHKPEFPNTPLRHHVNDVRDVFAVGLGRRVESHLGKDALYRIEIKDWETANNGDKPIAVALSNKIEGVNYIDYYNPNCWGYFLVDLIADKRTSIGPVPSVGGQLIGIEVKHDDMYGPIYVWLDPTHGYLPKVIEKYVRTNDRKAIFRQSKSEVTAFHRTEEGIWVPTAGTFLMFGPDKELKDRALSGSSIDVDIERSAWNSIESGELFAESSLPSVNNEFSGWKKYLSSSSLNATKRQDDLRREIRASAGAAGSRIRTIVVAANVVLILAVLVLIVLMKRYRHRLRTNPTTN